VANAAQVVFFGARRADGYSHVSQFISELGEHGSRDGFAVSWGAFAPVGALVLAFALLVLPAFRGQRLAQVGLLVIGVSVAIGYVGSAAFRCDPGCPEMGGSTTQEWHFIVSYVDYVGAAIGLGLCWYGLRASERWSRLARVALVGAVLVAASGPVISSFDGTKGLTQRAIEVVIFGWPTLVAIAILRRG